MAAIAGFFAIRAVFSHQIEMPAIPVQRIDPASQQVSSYTAPLAPRGQRYYNYNR